MTSITQSAGAPYANIESVIGGGQIMISTVAPIDNAAVAHDGKKTLAMLHRGTNESVADLLVRLDAAIADAKAGGRCVDEINSLPQMPATGADRARTASRRRLPTFNAEAQQRVSGGLNVSTHRSTRRKASWKLSPCITAQMPTGKNTTVMQKPMPTIQQTRVDCLPFMPRVLLK